MGARGVDDEQFFASAPDIVPPERSKRSSTSDAALPHISAPPARGTLERSFTLSDVPKLNDPPDQGRLSKVGKGKKRSAKAAGTKLPGRPTCSNDQTTYLPQLVRKSEATVSDTDISWAGSVEDKPGGPRQKTRKSLQSDVKKSTESRSKKALDATRGRKSGAPRKEASRRSVEKQPSVHSLKKAVIEEEGEGGEEEGDEEEGEEGVSALTYGFWNTREEDKRKFKKNAAAVRVDPRVLQPLHQQQVDKLFEKLGEHDEASEWEGVTDTEVSERELLPPKPVTLNRRGSVVSNLMAMRPESFTTGLQITRNSYAHPVVLNSEQVSERDCPDGFGRLSALFGGAKESLASLGAKRMTKTHITKDLRGMFTKLPSIMRK